MTETSVLYMAGHIAFVNFSLIHRLTINKSRKAILVYGSLMGAHPEIVNTMKEHYLFDDVFYASETVGNKGQSKSECSKIIEEYYDDVLKKNGYSLNDFDEFYIGSDTFISYGIYLTKKNKEIGYFEGGFKDFFHISKKRFNELNPQIATDAYKSLMNDLKISDGRNPLITCIVSPNSDYTCTDLKFEVFSIRDKLTELDDTTKSDIVSMYGIDVSALPKSKSNLVIMSSQWGLRMHPESQQTILMAYVYGLITDYFIKNDNPIVIKPHPLCKIPEKTFERYLDSPVLPRYFPSEYMQLLDLNIEESYSVASFGGNGSNEKYTCVGFTFYSEFDYVEILDAILSIYYEQFQNKKLCCFGFSKEFFTSNVVYNKQKINSFEMVDSLDDVRPETFLIANFNQNNTSNFDSEIREAINNGATCALIDTSAMRLVHALNAFAFDAYSLELEKSQIKDDANPHNPHFTTIFYNNKSNHSFNLSSFKYHFVQKHLGYNVNLKVTSVVEKYPLEIGRLYRYGNGVPKDLYKAAEWIRRAVLSKAGWSRNDLFDVLWEIGTPEAYREMIDVITPPARTGDVYYFSRSND